MFGGPTDIYEHDKEQLTQESPHARFLSEAVDMSSLLTEHENSGVSRDLLFQKLDRMTQALETLWNGVETGRIRVSSKALLRITRSISCPEIKRKLNEPCMDCTRIMRDLRLIINTFRYVIKPEQIF